MKLSVIGCGYLGAVHAASMAELDHDVIGADVDSARIELLAAGKAPFHEPGFDDLLAKDKDRLTFTTDMSVVNISDHLLISLEAQNGTNIACFSSTSKT